MRGKNIKLSKENEKILKEFFGINEYIVLGFFKKKFNITKYGLWYDKVNKIIIYKNSSVEKRLYKEMVFNDYENTNNFVLIGLKNEILYSNYHSLLEYFTIKKDDDESNNIKKNKWFKIILSNFNEELIWLILIIIFLIISFSTEKNVFIILFVNYIINFSINSIFSNFFEFN